MKWLFLIVVMAACPTNFALGDPSVGDFVDYCLADPGACRQAAQEYGLGDRVSECQADPSACRERAAQNRQVQEGLGRCKADPDSCRRQAQQAGFNW